MVKTSPFFSKGNSGKIGILGGTFNPPHFGHLRLAEEVMFCHGLDLMVFIPSFQPPHKGSRDLAPPEDRLEMARLACAENPRFEVSDMEISAKGPSYTVRTLETLSSRESGEFFFVLGTDSLREIHTWKDYRRLFELANFIVVTRPGTEFDDAWKAIPRTLQDAFHKMNDCYIHNSSHRLIPSSVTGLDVSSTRIRQLVKAGMSVRYLLPEAIRSYILQRKLYADENW